MPATAQPRSANSSWCGLAVVAVALLLLLPFVRKPFHLDDTVFVRIGQKILEQPLEPYNFVYCWNAAFQSMWLQTMHPPLYSYLLAAVGSIAGFSETAMHVAGLFFAGGCVWLMHRLATRFCEFPATATLVAVVTPGFLVSSTTVMADIPLLFFWLLAVQETVRAVDTEHLGRLWLAGLAAAAAVMTKYFGIALIPLLLVYWHVASRKIDMGGRISVDALALWLPVLVLIGWAGYSYEELGQFHPLAAVSYAGSERGLTVILGDLWRTIPYFGATILWPCALLMKARRLARR